MKPFEESLIVVEGKMTIRVSYNASGNRLIYSEIDGIVLTSCFGVRSMRKGFKQIDAFQDFMFDMIDRICDLLFPSHPKESIIVPYELNDDDNLVLDCFLQSLLLGD